MSEIIARKEFITLNKLSQCEYAILNDLNFVDKVYFENDSEAIRYFKSFTDDRESKRVQSSSYSSNQLKAIRANYARKKVGKKI